MPKQKKKISTEKLIDFKISEHKLKYDKKFTVIDTKLNVMQCTLNEIANVKVNGTLGLTKVLQDLYVATTELRTNYEMGSVFKKWLAQHKIIKYAISSKIGKVIIFSTCLFIFINIINSMGASIDPIQIFKNIFNGVIKLL